LQGGDDACIEAVSRRDLDSAALTEPERALMRFVELLTNHAWKNTAADVQKVRDAGWSDEQIAEAVYVTSLFAFFNRVADAFGLQDPGYLQMSPENRPEGPKEQPRDEAVVND
jgi:alkylhydroperoxidase family enzyme